jgi:PAT family beta-lactamase induction signal transducer AmpG
MITGQGLIVIIAGYMETSLGDNTKAWSYTMLIVGALMLLLTAINYLTTPKVEEDSKETAKRGASFGKVFSTFFTKKNIGISLAFVLLYRLGESQLAKMASPFLLEDRNFGGLGLSTTEVGFLYGTVGVIALLLGGILGGIAISRFGLGKWMIPMALSLNLPNLLYIALAHFQPENIVYAGAVVIIEQFGYGFGFAAYMVFLIYLAEGMFKTSHYAIATGFMAMGMMLPGMLSGFVQEWLGYTGFFIWVGVAMIPALIISRSVKYPKEFGKKTD